jgi:hypothetical protein
MTGVNSVQLFTSMYCGVIAAMVCIRHADQFAYLKLTRPILAPARILHRWPVPRLRDAQFHATGVGLALTLLMSAAGVFPRAALLLAVAFYFLYFGQISSLSYVQRKIYLMPQILLLLAVAPDPGRSSHGAAPAWPLLMVQAILAQMYLSSAFCKIRTSGIRWASWKQLQGILLEEHLTYDLPLSARLAQSRWFCGIFGVGALAFELTFWVILVIPRSAAPYAVTGLLLHVSALILMRIDYLTYHVPVYLVFAATPLARLLHAP